MSGTRPRQRYMPGAYPMIHRRSCRRCFRSIVPAYRRTLDKPGSRAVRHKMGRVSQVELLDADAVGVAFLIMGEKPGADQLAHDLGKLV